MFTICSIQRKRRWNFCMHKLCLKINRGYYMVERRYEFYFRVAKQYFTNEHNEWIKYCFCHEKIKFISSSRHVMFFLLYRQKDIDKIIELREITEITSLINSRVRLWKINHSRPGYSFYEFLRVVYFPAKHLCLYNKIKYYYFLLYDMFRS